MADLGWGWGPIGYSKGKGGTIVQHVGWLIQAPNSPEKANLIEDLRKMCCDHLNLCAATGCSCTTGIGDKLCREGGEGPVYYSTGPHWLVVIAIIPTLIRIDVYTDLFVGEEIRALEDAVHAYSFPCSRTGIGIV